MLMESCNRWGRSLTNSDLCGGELDWVFASHWVRDFLQDQSHSVGIFLHLLHEVSSAPAHLMQQEMMIYPGQRSLFHLTVTVNERRLVAAHTDMKPQTERTTCRQCSGVTLTQPCVHTPRVLKHSPLFGRWLESLHHQPRSSQRHQSKAAEGDKQHK